MKHLKRFLSVLLTLTVLCTCLIPAASAVDDITGHWSETYLREMHEHGIINPNGSGSYTPNAVITRAEFMRYINRAFGFTQKADISKYTDVTSDKWYYETVQIAAKYGYISGTGTNKMGPESPITREQVCAILGRLSKKDYPTASAASLPFVDSDSIASWCLPYVSALAEDNVMVGDTNNRYRPKASVTRGEIARILYAYLGSQLDQNVIYSASDLRMDATGATITAASILQDSTIAGDLYISEGLNTSSNVTLRNVSVLGTLIIAGGSVTLDNVNCENLLISSPFDSKLNISAVNGTEIENTRAVTEAVLSAASGATFGTVTGATPTDAPAAATVTPGTLTIDRNAQATDLLTFTLTAAEGTDLQYLLLGNTMLQAGLDYAYDSTTGVVQLTAGKLTSLGAGEFTLTFKMSAGSAPTVSLTVTDSTPTASITPEEMVFAAATTSLYHRDITVWLALDAGMTVNRITAAEETLLPGVDFLIVDDRVILFRESLAALTPDENGSLDLVFNLSNGGAPTLRLTYI